MAEGSAIPYSRWTELPDDQVSADTISEILGAIPDDVWATAGCADRVLDDTTTQQALLIHGISRTDAIVDRCKDLVQYIPSSDGSELEHSSQEVLLRHFQNVPTDAQLCQLRSLLLQRLDRVNTFVELEKVAAESVEGQEVVDDEIDEWEDDPWADGAASSSTKTTPRTMTTCSLPFSLSTFLLNGLAWSARELASLQYFDALRVLTQKHASELWPHRFSILDAIPEHAPPLAYRQFLPSLDISTNVEAKWTEERWRPHPDFSEQSTTESSIRQSGATFELLSHFSQVMASDPQPWPPEKLASWYAKRVDRITNTTGMIDMALTIIQHGASQGIPGLDQLGEDLSLLSRLVYDAPQDPSICNDWTLDGWSLMSPEAVVRAYLAQSTPDSLPRDIARLAMPYLFVLEAREERAGNPDPGLPNRLLYDYILSIPLELAASIFEASKPTLPTSQRILRNDEDIARLALACLYGSDSLDEWATMSRIFECMPAWETNKDQDTDEEAADTTIASLGAFVKPTTARPRCTPKDLLLFFAPLSAQSLSRALDILDMHLESGEILSRWSVPAPLRWFLQSSDDVQEQRAWATRMARRAGGSFDPLNTSEDWEWLLEDMLKLTDKTETGLRGAFGLLSREEVIGIYLSGLLSTGKFDIAKGLLHRPHTKLALSPETIEDISLKCSNELYDNASSGNYKVGDMKLAYDCLDVPSPSARIEQEKEFIEATSRISSFNVTSRPGIPISPIEIRLTKDRLSLISRILSSNGDAYKHTEVMLDLCYKLGFRNDVTAEVKVLAMMADTALQAEDFGRAYESSRRMVDTVHNLQSSSSQVVDDTKVKEAMEVCWIACFQLGRQPEYRDLSKKMTLLGYALELCPADKLHDVITAWRKLQQEDIEIREDRLAKRQSEVPQSARPLEHTNFIPRNVASTLRARLQDLHMPSPPLLSTPDAAALASRTFKSVAANFPFAIGHRAQSQVSDDRVAHSEGSWKDVSEDVSSQASRAFSKGIGWLIGVDE